VYSRSGRYFGWIGQDAAEHNGGLVIALAAEVERLTPPRAPDEGAREGDVTAADRLFSIVSAVMGSGRGADCAAEWTQVDEIASNIRLAAPAPSPDVSEDAALLAEIRRVMGLAHSDVLKEYMAFDAHEVERSGYVSIQVMRNWLVRQAIKLSDAARLAAVEGQRHG